MPGSTANAGPYIELFNGQTIIGLAAGRQVHLADVFARRSYMFGNERVADQVAQPSVFRCSVCFGAPSFGVLPRRPSDVTFLHHLMLSRGARTQSAINRKSIGKDSQ
jgi:hypothetical protein